MTIGRFVAVVLVFVAGFITAAVIPNRHERASKPLDYSQPVKVVLASNPGDPENAEFVSHRVVVDGEGHDVRPSPRRENAEVWRIEMAGGRLVLFGTRRSFE
jgi:hypothetical protein